MSILPNKPNNDNNSKNVLQSLQSLSFDSGTQKSAAPQSSQPSGRPMGPMPLSPITPKPTSQPVSQPAPVQQPHTNVEHKVEPKTEFHPEPRFESTHPSPVSSISSGPSMGMSFDMSAIDGLTSEGVAQELIQGMLQKMNEIAQYALAVKKKTGYDVCTVVGNGNSQMLVFNTAQTVEAPYITKVGKQSTMKVHLFAAMTPRGNIAIRVPSVLRTKFEDALKYSSSMNSAEFGFFGSGPFAEVVMKVPSNEYGNDNLIKVPLKDDSVSSVNVNNIDFVDVVEPDFIEQVLDLTASEVEAFVTLTKDRQVALAELNRKKMEELKKASAIASKLQSLAS